MLPTIISSSRGSRFWLNAWLPVVVGVAVIALESTEILGADHTSGPLRLLFQAIFGPVSNAHWEILHSLVRKSGHFLGYGAIGLTWLRALKLTLPHSRLIEDSVLALIGTALVASADEYHQAFLPNRTGSPWDVLLDCCGVIALQLAVYVSMRLFRPKSLAQAA